MENALYDNLISKFSSYCNNDFSQVLKGKANSFDIISPLKKKMQICLNALQNYNKTKSEKDSIKNQFLSSIFNKCFLNANINKKLALNRLLKNRKDKLQMEKDIKLSSNFLVKYLIRSCEAKKNECYNLLNKNNSDINDLSENKLNALQKVLTTLVNYCNRKRMVTLDNLRNNNIFKKKIMRQVGNKIIKEHQNKKRFVLSKLLENLKKRKESERLKIKCLKTIFINHAKKLKNIMDKLSDYNKTQKQEYINNNGTRLRAVKILRNALLNKEKKCFKNLTKNNLVKKIEQIKSRGKQKYLLNKIISNMENKKRRCLNELRNNLYKKKTEEEKKNTILKRLAKNYKKNNVNVKRKILNNLTNNKNIEISKHKRRDNLLLKISKGLETKSRRNIKSALNEMRKNNEKIKSDKINQNRASKIVGTKIKNRLDNNLRNALQKLKDNNRSRKQTELMNNKITNTVLRKFIGRQLRKSSSALNSLKDNNNKKRLEEERKIKSMRSLINRLFQAIHIKKRNVLDKMIELKNEKKRDNEIKTVKLGRMFNMLEKRSMVKVSNSVGKLFENREEDLKNRNKIKKMINLFYDKNRNKLRDIINTLRENNIKRGHENEIRLKTLSSLMNNTYKRSLLKYFEKLVIHYMETLLKENKQKNAFSKIGIMNKFKTYKSLKNLQKLNNNLVQKRMVFSKLFASSDAKKLKALDTINKYKNNRNRDITQATRLVKNNILKDIQYYFKMLKLNNFLINRNKISKRLNNMIYCIRKNHRANLRTSIHHWAGTEYKNKVRLLTEKLERLIMFRKINAYEAIKKKYLYMKFEKTIKGLMKLITLVETKQMDNKAYFMKTFIDTFTDKNPWFKKTIHILAILSKPNDQIAFWRMRYAKNLKKEGLSAEQSLKLKKVFYIVNREVQKNLSHSFWKINAFADKSLSQTQVGFGSMMNRY